MGVSVSLRSFPRVLFEQILFEPELRVLVGHFFGSGTPYSWFGSLKDEIDEHVEHLVQVEPELFPDEARVIDSMNRLEKLLHDARDRDPDVVQRNVFFQKSDGVFRHLLSQAIQAKHGIDATHHVDRIMFGTSMVDPGNSESASYVEAAGMAEVADWLRELVISDLAQQFDGPEMERLSLYRMRPWDSGKPKEMPADWRKDLEEEFTAFRSLVLGAVQHGEIIVSRVG